MSTRAEQRQEEMARRRRHHFLRHHYLARPKGFGRGCLICGKNLDEHEDEPADQEEPGDVGESPPAGGDAGGGSAGGGAAAGP